MRKLSYEEVKQAFESRGCILISEKYVRSKDKLKFKCTCGRISEIAFDKFRRGQLCGGCKGERNAKRTKYSIEYVRKVFEKGGCKLLTSEYKNNKQKMQYECECGMVSEISLSKFLAGQRCLKCKSRKISEKLSGPNHPLYKPEKTDEERIRDRKYPEYYEWRRSVYERDDYTCQNCFEKGGRINAHHIEAYSKNMELRTDVSNGITLCEDCHKQYHEDFYRNDATEGTFLEYMRGEYNGPPPYVN